MNLNDIRNKNINIIKNQIMNVYFSDIEKNLLEKIQNAHFIMGCISWLTNNKIIQELEKKKGIKIIVQKEFFLKRDYNYYICNNNYYINLRKGYKSLPNLFNNIDGIEIDKESPIYQLCTKKLADDDDFDAIRCFGYANKNIKPLMHHKFLIFFDENLNPTGVWTGSYNLTNNSNKSLDNAIYLEDINIIKNYIFEFEQIMFLSEKLNWDKKEPKNI